MPDAFLWQYPEFLAAGAVGLGALTLQMAGERKSSKLSWLPLQSRALLQSMPPAYRRWLWRHLVWAGWRSQEHFDYYAITKLCLSVACSLTFILLPPLPVIALCLVAYLLPDLVIFFLAKRRQRELLHALPQALDLMVLCVDAGLGLDATLQRIAMDKTAVASVLNDELAILGRDIWLGMDRERAYLEMYRRTGVEELKTLGSALIQASKLGLSVARILRAQSEYVRLKQSQRAEEHALKLPVLMAFPLWFCIMPCLMLLVLGPSLMTFYAQVQPGVMR